MLAGGPGNLPHRQRALRATLDWSYELLGAKEQLLFQRLGVFVGGWTLEAIEAICTDQELTRPAILWLLNNLIDKSLVVVEAQDDQVRYRFLETIRQYSLEKLRDSGQTDEWGSRHQTYFMRLAENAAPKLQGSQQIYWLHQLEAEHANFRTALDWANQPGAAEANVEAGFYTALALWEFWYIRGYYNEARHRLQRLVDSLAGTDLEHTAAYGWLLGRVGYFALKQGDYEAGRRLSETSLSRLQAWEDRAGVAFALNNLGMIENDQANYSQARLFFEEALAAARPAGDKRCIAMQLNNLGEMSQMLNQFEVATGYFEESLALFQELGSFYLQAYVLNNWGTLSQQQGNLARAQELQLQSLDLFYKVGDKRGIGYCLAGLASLAAAHGQLERTACLLGFLETVLTSFAGAIDGSATLQSNLAWAAIRQPATDQTSLDQSHRQGRAMSLEQGLAYARQEEPG